MRLVGAPLLWTVPLVPPVGNVTTCAVAVSLGGRLDVAVVCSPESADLADALARDLHAGLDEIAALAAGTRTQLPGAAPEPRGRAGRRPHRRRLTTCARRGTSGGTHDDVEGLISAGKVIRKIRRSA